MADHVTQFRDSLGAAHSYLHAIKRLAETTLSGRGEDYCALDLLADAAQAEIKKAQLLVDEMEGGEC